MQFVENSFATNEQRQLLGQLSGVNVVEVDGFIEHRLKKGTDEVGIVGSLGMDCKKEPPP